MSLRLDLLDFPALRIKNDIFKSAKQWKNQKRKTFQSLSMWSLSLCSTAKPA